LGGEIRLDPGAARRAVGQLADQLHVALEQTAAGMLRISEAKITGAIREISVKRGFHPKDFALLAFGGGGGFVATGVAKELGAPTVVIPPGPANFSALGMLMVDVVHDFAQTHVTELLDADVSTLNNMYTSLIQRGSELLARDGFPKARQRFFCSAELRYQGQEHTVNAPLAGQRLTAPDLPRIADAFHAAHLAHYGHRMHDPVELVTVRVSAVGLLPLPTLPAGHGKTQDARKGVRRVYQFVREEYVSYVVYDRGRLFAGDCLEGPAIVEEPSATTVLHEGDVMTVGRYGELNVTVGK
jgi:N-methylhydantoinase A